ncbi:hypothetical protein NQ314_020207 [Rhamnusium bicolor]|uniref:Uncharacterized protein n=1 Tax=Rhamnusium bicolor TaxID=1586634 RepID=A0AAV8WLE0_9CUCU|nr:hypothetical protein NQ314_020207 [Rhamnusium bicolor]
MSVQILISPSSLQDANSPEVTGFQATQFISWLCALSIVQTKLKIGAFGSHPSSSLKILRASSPQAVAINPVFGDQLIS